MASIVETPPNRGSTPNTHTMNNFETLPQDLQTLIEDFGDETSYDKIEQLKKQFEEKGYTFDYGTDGVITDFYVLCSCCQKGINEDDGVYYTLDNKPYCDTCYYESWNYANTVITAHNGDIVRYMWCQEFGFRDNEFWEETSPDGVDGFKYIRTDGWRGYWDPVVSEGYTALASGWSTGRWDDVAYKHNFNDLVDAILEGTLECPFAVVFAFGITSNVFSTASDVIIKSSDLEAFQEWLCQEAGITTEELIHSLK